MNFPLSAIQLGLPAQVKERLGAMNIAVVGVECATFQDTANGYTHIRVVLTRTENWRSHCWDRAVSKFELLANRPVTEVSGILLQLADEAADAISVAVMQDIMLGN